jgi:hypothetical protein
MCEISFFIFIFLSNIFGGSVIVFLLNEKYRVMMNEKNHKKEQGFCG